MSKKVKIILFIVVAVIIAVMIFINLKKNRGTTTEVSLTEVKRGDITKTVSGSGFIQPEIDIQISARISSEIMKIYVKEGDIVKRGQLLVRLDSLRYVALLDQARSAVSSSQASLKKAKADYVRTKNLFDQNLTTQADLDGVEASMFLAQSNLEQSNARKKQAKDDLDKTTLSAPMAGTVTKLYKEEGEIAVGSQFQADPIMTVSDLSKMEVLSEIDENDVVLVSLADSTKIEIDAIPDTTFDGIISEIAHEATTRGRGTQEQVTNFEVKIAVNSDVENLRPGMSATIDISTETHKDVLFVPIQCVTMRSVKDSTKTEKATETDSTEDKEQSGKKDTGPAAEKKEVVFVVKDDVVKTVPVKTGISDDTNIEIISGLEEDQKIVSGSYKALSTTLNDGDKVKEKKGKGSQAEGSGD
jgi:HlyD family secretion protein